MRGRGDLSQSKGIGVRAGGENKNERQREGMRWAGGDETRE